MQPDPGDFVDVNIISGVATPMQYLSVGAALEGAGEEGTPDAHGFEHDYPEGYPQEEEVDEVGGGGGRAAPSAPAIRRP